MDERKRSGKSAPRLKPAVSISSKRTELAKACDSANRDAPDEASVWTLTSFAAPQAFSTASLLAANDYIRPRYPGRLIETSDSRAGPCPVSKILIRSVDLEVLKIPAAKRAQYWLMARAIFTLNRQRGTISPTDLIDTTSEWVKADLY